LKKSKRKTESPVAETTYAVLSGMRAANHSSLIRSFLIDSVPPQARCGKFFEKFFHSADCCDRHAFVKKTRRGVCSFVGGSDLTPTLCNVQKTSMFVVLFATCCFWTRRALLIALMRAR
jgi:hypothetical protein